jgi:hypothetical protein
MAGFYICNNEKIFNRVLDNSKTEYPKRKIIRHVGGWQIAIFQKINLKNHQNIYYNGNDFIAGTGIYFYKKLFGFGALSQILSDFKMDKNIFQNVRGHFNFVIFFDGKLYLVTDKTGHYFSLKATDETITSYSTSFMLLCDSLQKLIPQKQELLEYLNVAATFGGKTIFKNINHLKNGFVYSLSEKETSNQYFTKEIKFTSLDDFFENIEDYFNIFKKTKLRIGCDLSGGFDTRTVASILLHQNIDFTFLSNNRSQKISSDLKVAKKIASKTGKELLIIKLENSSRKDFTDRQSIKMVEIARGLDIAKRVCNEIINKSEIADVIVGGWGAEILRNQHGRFPNISEVAKGYGYNRISLKTHKSVDYINNLKEKFEEDISTYKFGNETSVGELIFYLERGKYWAGSMLTARNKYAYWLFPFFDASITYKMLALKNKRNSLQKRVIEHFYPQLSKIQFGNVDTESLMITFIKKMIKNVISPSRLSKIKRVLKDKPKADYHEECLVKKNAILSDILNFDSSDLKKNGEIRSIAKWNTLNILFDNFQGVIQKKVEI